MEVTILKGENTAMDLKGNIYVIEGLEITREQSKERLTYRKDTTFYRACVHAGMRMQAYIKDGRLVLI